MSNNNHGAGIGNEDDDFEDFGGFETADPAPDMAVAQAQAGASPWALLNAGNIPDRPDLLCAQNHFPNCLDPLPSDILGSRVETDVNINNASLAPPDLPPADLLGGQLQNQARIAEDVLDGTLNPIARGPVFHSNNNGRLPDIGLGNNENGLFGQAIGGAGPEPEQALVMGVNVNSNRSASLDLGLEGNADAREQPAAMGLELIANRQGDGTSNHAVSLPNVSNIVNSSNAGQELHAHVVSTGSVAASSDAAARCSNGSTQGSRLDGALAVPLEGAEAVLGNHDALQQRLLALTDENERLQDELTKCGDDLATQRSRIQDMEERHEATLRDVRKAGHDALAVVVEQYKEQVRVAVLEQQEEARRQMAETVREQTRAFQDMLHIQEEERKENKIKEKAEFERRLKEAIEQSRQEQQEQFQAFLATEQDKQRQASAKALEDEANSCEVKMQEFMTAETERLNSRLEDATNDFSQRVEEERRKHEAALVSVREEQKLLAKEQMAELAKAERERGRELTQSAVEACRVESRSYLQEQREADSRVRQRHLASLDLFLESSRHQIGLLMETERRTPSSQLQSSPSLSQSATATPQGASSSPPSSASASSQPQPNGEAGDPHLYGS